MPAAARGFASENDVGILRIFNHFEAFHGTKPAQHTTAELELSRIFFLSAEARNLQVIGSNSARTGKGAQRAHHWFHVQTGPQPLRGGVADSSSAG
jgi:hypothetical protein